MTSLQKQKEHIISVCTEMMLARGYNQNIPYEEGILFKKGDDNKEDPIYVIYYHEDKINIEMFKELVTFLLKYSLKHAIMIYSGALTPLVKESLKNNEPKIEAFHQYNMSFNPTKFVYANKHSKATSEEREELMKKVGKLENNQRIYSSEPIARWYGFQPGDLIRIERETELIYKYVIEG